MPAQKANLIDPENRLLWRMNVHRLTWEEFRDTLLATSGQLDPRIGGRGPRTCSRGLAPRNRRRTLYGTVDPPVPALDAEDVRLREPDLSIPARSETTVPQQALFSLNHPLMAEKARSLAAHAKLDEVTDPPREVATPLSARRSSASRHPPSAKRLSPSSATRSTCLPRRRAKSPRLGAMDTGELDEAAGALKSFTPLPYFNGHAWQGGV